MTNDERIKMRIARDKARRYEKKRQKQLQYSYETMLPIKVWFDALRKCQIGTSWKGTVQWFIAHPCRNSYEHREAIRKVVYPFKPNTKRVVLYERGHERKIVPVRVESRQVCHVFCDQILSPYYQDYLIYDNGASMKGRGVDFARRRMMRHIEKAVRTWGGDNIYALTFDFKGYFDNISHAVCNDILSNDFDDNRIVWFGMKSITDYQASEVLIEQDTEKKVRLQHQLDTYTGCGISLGSQVSQNIALIVPNRLDHFIKDTMRMKYYIRYMDDGIILSNSKDELLRLLDMMKVICEQLQLKLNPKKTRVVKASKGFTFLKTRYYITANNEIIRKMPHKSITRMRRKLKKFKGKVDDGLMTMENVRGSFQSWNNYAQTTSRSYQTRKQMKKLYCQLFEEEKVCTTTRLPMETPLLGLVQP